jgi:hypothetical protein
MRNCDNWPANYITPNRHIPCIIFSPSAAEGHCVPSTKEPHIEQANSIAALFGDHADWHFGENHVSIKTYGKVF